MAVCCICERAVDRWLPYPKLAERSQFMVLMESVGSDLNNFHCPHCRSTDRDRHLWMYMAAAGLPERLGGSSILHLAPEAPLEPLIERCAPARYVRGDLYPTKPHYQRLNAEALPFENESFDLVIANHLLEHVAHPERAIAEFDRCLKPGGILIAQTPYSPKLKKTFELNVAAPAEFAKVFYGQEDHVRLFGSDIVDYFHAQGLQGELLPHDAVLRDMDAQEFGCNRREPFFAFSKPMTSSPILQPQAA